VWGGMWSLPELAPEADPASHCHDRFGFTAQAQRSWPRCSHSFTHFKLHILPVELELAPRRATLPGQIWLPPSDALDAALPAPVRKLVARLGKA
jgi:A/G-specific adenine glycosylase